MIPMNANAKIIAILWATLLAIAGPLAAEDWPQFRGALQDGTSPSTGVPTTWSVRENVLWWRALPGRGGSSPVISAGKVYLTCYTGYGMQEGETTSQSALARHLLCFDLKTGQPAGRFSAKPRLPENEFWGFLALHGYASSTPAVDADSIYLFYGKSGVGALGLDGRPKWSRQVGNGTHDWGSASSPVLYKDLVIVNAGVECGAVVAIDKTSGKIVWSQRGVQEAWSTPVLVKVSEDKFELVLSSHGEIQGYDPDTGKPLWRAPGIQDYVCPSVVAHDGIVYAIGARSGMGVAVQAGGRGDVAPLWVTNRGSNVCSPVYHEGYLYWTHESQGIAYCANAKTGEGVYEQRLNPRPGRIYASAVLAGGNIYYVSRGNGTYVVAAKPQFHLVAYNEPLDESTADGSPAVADDKLVIRTNAGVYCIGK
jgi:hypothetical protein